MGHVLEELTGVGVGSGAALFLGTSVSVTSGEVWSSSSPSEPTPAHTAPTRTGQPYIRFML